MCEAVYFIVNLINAKTYVGSSVNLGRRLGGYFCIYFGLGEDEIPKGNMAIYKSLLKYGGLISSPLEISPLHS